MTQHYTPATLAQWGPDKLRDIHDVYAAQLRAEREYADELAERVAELALEMRRRALDLLVAEAQAMGDYE
jgi:hypothetical protein